MLHAYVNCLFYFYFYDHGIERELFWGQKYHPTFY